MTAPHDIYIKRCFALAKKGGKHVKSNPRVGAVLVYKDKIIGEGYHEIYGGHHAEVNAINSVSESNKEFIRDATLYVSLEPCCHVGKTPACTQLVIAHKIKKVVVSCKDPNPLVAGKGIALLEKEGIKVITGILEGEGQSLINPFIKSLKKMPFITLKWAKSKDGFMGKSDQQIWLSNDVSKIASHQLRAEHDAILIGTNTAIIDNPKLNTRLVHGENPLRIVLDRLLKIPKTNKLLSDQLPTLIINEKIEGKQDGIEYIKLSFDDDNFLNNLLHQLYVRKCHRLLVEGGKTTLNHFIKKELWDQAYVIHTPKILDDGIRSPNLSGKLEKKWLLGDDRIDLISKTVNKR